MSNIEGVIAKVKSEIGANASQKISGSILQENLLNIIEQLAMEARTQPLAGYINGIVPALPPRPAIGDRYIIAPSKVVSSFSYGGDPTKTWIGNYLLQWNRRQKKYVGDNNAIVNSSYVSSGQISIAAGAFSVMAVRAMFTNTSITGKWIFAEGTVLFYDANNTVISTVGIPTTSTPIDVPINAVKYALSFSTPAGYKLKYVKSWFQRTEITENTQSSRKLYGAVYEYQKNKGWVIRGVRFQTELITKNGLYKATLMKSTRLDSEAKDQYACGLFRVEPNVIVPRVEVKSIVVPINSNTPIIIDTQNQIITDRAYFVHIERRRKSKSRNIKAAKMGYKTVRYVEHKQARTNENTMMVTRMPQISFAPSGRRLNARNEITISLPYSYAEIFNNVFVNISSVVANHPDKQIHIMTQPEYIPNCGIYRKLKNGGDLTLSSYAHFAIRLSTIVKGKRIYGERSYFSISMKGGSMINIYNGVAK